MARERYLVGQGEETIHQEELKATTVKQKSQNWWYYHKVHVVVGAVLLLIFGSFVYSLVARVNPDYYVALMTSYTMPQTVVSQLEEHLATYGEDSNGDGKVVVGVTNYVFSAAAAASDPMQIQAASVKFMADCTSNQSMIFIHDQSAFEYVQGTFDGFLAYNDGTPMQEGAVDFKEAMLPWADFQGLVDFKPAFSEGTTLPQDALQELFDELRVSVRTAEGSSIEKNEKDMTYFKNSMRFYERIKTGQKS